MTKNWLSVKSTIKELYVVQGKSLTEVARHLRDDSGFIASTRAYRIKLLEWGFKRARCGSSAPVGPSSYLRAETTESPKASNSGAHPAPAIEQVLPTSLKFANPDLAVLLESMLEANIDRFKFCLNLVTRHFPINGHMMLGSFSDNSRHLQDFIGRTLLSVAASCSSTEVVNILLRKGAEIDYQDRGTRLTPLMVAIMRDDYEIVNVLLEQGASKALLDSGGHHALHIAALSAKDTRIMGLLTKAPTALLDAPAGAGPDEGITALGLAIVRKGLCTNQEDHLITSQMIRCLLRVGAQLKGSEDLITMHCVSFCLSQSFADDDVALLLQFVDAGLDLQYPVEDLPDSQHLNPVPLGHALVFHAGAPGFGSFLAHRVSISQPKDEKDLLHTLCSGCFYNEDVRVENDVCTAISILLRRGINPNTVDSTCYTPLNCFLDSVAWYTGNRPKRLDCLRLLLEHGADSCSGDGHSYPIRQALEGPGYTMEEDDEDFDYVSDVICLLMQHFPSSMRGAPRWQRETLHDYLPITPRFSDYFECSHFDALLKQHSGLTVSSAAIFRRAAQAVSIRRFLDSQMSLMPLYRNQEDIMYALESQQRQKLPNTLIPREY